MNNGENIKAVVSVDSSVAETVAAEQKAKAFEMLQELVGTEKGRKVIADAITKTVPSNEVPSKWSRSTVAPYYKEHFAREVQIVLDQIMLDGKAREWRYDDFNLSRRSLYNRIHQAIKYLLDKLDTDGKYLAFRQRLVITQEKTGVRMSVISEADSLAKKVTIVEDKSKSFEYKIKVDDFLERGKLGEMCEIKNLSLTPEEIEDLQVSFAGIKGLIVKITPKEIKLLKISPEFSTE